MTETPTHIEQAEGLRALAAFIEANPDLAEHTRFTFEGLNAFTSDRQVLAAYLRAGMRHGAEATKETKGDTWFYVRLAWGAVELHVNAHREQVCERVQVGTETVTERDPAALDAVPMVEVERPVYEWQCSPLLAGGEDQ